MIEFTSLIAAMIMNLKVSQTKQTTNCFHCPFLPASVCLLPALLSFSLLLVILNSHFSRRLAHFLISLSTNQYRPWSFFDFCLCCFVMSCLGGHIIDALNLSTEDQLSAHFFPSPSPSVPVPPQPFCDNDDSTLIIFHCEFSTHRAPRRSVSDLILLRSSSVLDPF